MAYNVLFLCTANSARSIIAESLLNALGGGRFRAFSAGSHPSGRVNPLAIEVLAANGYPVSGVRSKGWDEIALRSQSARDRQGVADRRRAAGDDRRAAQYRR